jgi:fructose-1,6-bisphosphatase/inositol monophosphatase family enzyme
VWVADPVDGTHNFVHGKREFGVMLAAVHNGEIVHGWIYDVLDRKMMHAEKGAGAYFDGQRLKTAAPKPLDQLIGHIGAKYYPDRVRPFLKEQKKKVASARSLHCAAHEYLLVLTGQADFGIYSRVKPWDHLAGALAVNEAGGSATLWNGQPYFPAFTGNGLMVASHPDVARELRAAIVDELVDKLKPKP